MKKIIFILLFFFYCWINSSIVPVYAEDSESAGPKVKGESEAETSLVIRGESKIKVETLKKNVPLIETWDKLGSLDNWIDVKMKNIQKFDEISDTAVSFQTYSPTLSPISFSSQVLNLPVPSILAKEWKVLILNFQGKVIDSFQGEGNPPSFLVWSGFPSEDIVPQVGFPYSYFLEIKDREGKIYRYEGDSFRYSSLAQKEKNSFTISYPHSALLKEGKAEISPEGEMLLKRGVQMLREYMGSKHSLKLEMYERENELAQTHKDLLLQFLQKELILSPEDIQVKIYLIPYLEPLQGCSKISTLKEKSE